MELTTRTLESAALSTAQYFGIPHTYPPNSTLNEYLNIENGVLPGKTIYPRTRYQMIGYGGHRPFTPINGRVIAQPIQHRTTDTGLFKPLPFVLREPNNDLLPTERMRYRLRKVDTYNGVPYIAYYAKIIDVSQLTIERQMTTVQDGKNVLTSDYVYNAANMAPQPTQPLKGLPDLTNGTFVSPNARIWVGLDNEWEANELLNVSKVIFNDEYGALISEIALVAAVDKDVTVGGGSGTGGFTFTEIIGAQIMNFLSVQFNVALGVNLRAGTYVTAGIAEPMYVLS